MLGALCHYISKADPENYQPTNATFGLLPQPEGVRKKKERKEARVRIALEAIDEWLSVGQAS